MAKLKRHFQKFDTADDDDMVAYQEILDNPLSKITERETTNEDTDFYDGEGRLIRSEKRIVYLVHWEESLI